MINFSIQKFFYKLVAQVANYLISSPMDEIKTFYEPPFVEVIEIEVEQILASSGAGNTPDFDLGDDF